MLTWLIWLTRSNRRSAGSEKSTQTKTVLDQEYCFASLARTTTVASAASVRLSDSEAFEGSEARITARIASVTSRLPLKNPRPNVLKLSGERSGAERVR